MKGAIAGLNYLIQNAGKDGVEEVIIGMAHRGRLMFWLTFWAKNRLICLPNSKAEPKSNCLAAT